tara:strand:- start:32 stop:2887 length:2856 start_codon:yes stop_codon:yes gene_type:complete
MQKHSMSALWASSALAGGNIHYLEYLYELYLQDPTLVSENWQQYFSSLPMVEGKNGKDVSHAEVCQQFIDLAKMPVSMRTQQQGNGHQHQSVSVEHEYKQIQVLRLINAYRLQGHLHAQIDPLSLREVPKECITELTLEDHGLSIEDMSTSFDSETFVGPKQMTLGELYRALNDAYCGSIGTEYMHISSPEERAWIQERIEGTRATPKFTNEKCEHILDRITAAEGLEKQLGKKFPGAKRFSLEGGDSLIPLLDEVIQRAGSQSTQEVVIGMAHRGRLNVLINILGKSSTGLFDEFAGKHNTDLESGDVKYHQGFSADVATPGGNVHLALAFNPSHLEIVTPVVTGSVRARQARLGGDDDPNKALSIAIHGDSAFSGQGVVMETLNMSQTRGYSIGGTLHIIINNQVGFTTSNPNDMRSTLYCSDVAKVVLAPIFHVNGDDPEAVVLAAQLALDYKMKFKKDVVIDLVCYRRHGHNEADDPSATQPVMYKKVKRHPTTREVYAKHLCEAKILSAERCNELVKLNRKMLETGECVASNVVTDVPQHNAIDWKPFFSDDWREKINTNITQQQIAQFGQQLLELPTDLSVHSRVQKIYDDRVKMVKGEIPIDWGFAETLAYASLLNQKTSVRISGQDSGRGTFFHRHAVIHDQKTGTAYIPLEKVVPAESNTKFTVIDSVLSEEAVLAFEYGYTTADPYPLVIWEAQFGDFANGAQVVIDQFISSGEQKWGRLCGLVMLLPHGYEGQGPEHSSARLERYLQLCAEHNIQVCVPSSASQVFHMIRRQIMRKIRIPLVVMSPKSLLRHKAAASPIEKFVDGEFKVIIPDTIGLDKKSVTKVILCSGKVYYDLFDEREAQNKSDTAIIRIEQLYPFPETELKKILAEYTNAKKIIWCQEEPKNQGAWFPVNHHFTECMQKHQELLYAGRAASAAPAAGYISAHNEQQKQLVEDALNI